MPIGTQEMKSHQFFHSFRKWFGVELIYRFFGHKNARSAHYWCQDPDYTNKPDDAHDPIRGVKLMIDHADTYGHVGWVRSLIAYLKSGTSIEETYIPGIGELKPTLTEEMLADYEALARLFKAMNDCDNVDQINSLKQAAIEEVERTVAKYVEDCRRG